MKDIYALTITGGGAAGLVAAPFTVQPGDDLLRIMRFLGHVLSPEFSVPV